MDEEEQLNEPVEILTFLAKISRAPAGESFMIVKAVDSMVAMEMVVKSLKISGHISWSLKAIQLSEMIGAGDLLFQKTRFE